LFTQLAWTRKALAIFLGVSRKALVKAQKILLAERFEDEIMVRGIPTRIIFNYGFFSFTKKIKNKRREILAPHPDVQKIFRALGDKLYKPSRIHKKAFGFVKKRSILLAAKSLLGNRHFFSFDIASAFPSITEEMVRKTLQRLRIETYLIDPLVWIVTHYYNQERRLPQGSSCSPVLMNLVYRPMCDEIERVCKAAGIDWFVYADDFHFAAENVSPEIKAKLLAIPPRYGFSIKKEKTHDNLGKTIPHLLGLTIIDEKIHLKRKTKKKFRQLLYCACQNESSISPKKINGIIASIRQVYGPEKNWPGWLLKDWLKYQQHIGGNYAKNIN
jgi:hypothetical protein